MVSKYLISLVILGQVLSCQTASDTFSLETQEPLLECLVGAAIEADQTFDSSQHYLLIVQEYRVDMDYHTLSVQRHEFSQTGSSSRFYQSIIDGVVVKFYYYNNLSDRIESRDFDTLVISNQSVWSETILQTESGDSNDLPGAIYDPWININLLYDASSKCFVDSIMYTTLGIDSAIRSDCNMCSP